MPLVQIKNINPFCTLGIWHILESDADLLKAFPNSYYEIDQQKRINGANARHYLASRLILIQLFPNQSLLLEKDLKNKPTLFLNGEARFVSITHSHDYAAILVSEKEPIGIDLEMIDPRISRVKHKFMNQNELDFAGNEDQLYLQTAIWSAKETLFKVYGQKELDFKENLWIKPFEPKPNGIMEATISKGNFVQTFAIYYETIENYILTYTNPN